MTFSMEGRTPFIDKKLFNKLFYISDKEKIYNGISKFYIRKFLDSNIQNYNFFEKKKVLQSQYMNGSQRKSIFYGNCY